MSSLLTKRYSVIVVDPPWQTMGGSLVRGVGEGWQFPGKKVSRPVPYRTMSIREIAALPIADLADADAALYLWTINGYVEHVYAIARAWGFVPSTLLTWCKAPMGGGLGGAFGITSEYVLYARRGKPVERRTTGTWFQWKRSYVNGKPSHSRKPAHFYDLVEQVNDGPYVEVFARQHRLGWDVWGDESANTAELAVW
jgi:N6-adenosine-specific RNA methylase IME4